MNSPVAEAHDPALDEHVFMSKLQPLTFEGPGRYMVNLGIETERVSTVFRYPFVIAPPLSVPAGG